MSCTYIYIIMFSKCNIFIRTKVWTDTNEGNSYYYMRICTPSHFKSRAPVLSSRVVVKRQGFQIDLTLAIQQVCSIMHPCNKQATLFFEIV